MKYQILTIFFLFSILSSPVEAGPGLCAACVTGCGATCAFTLFGVVPCTVSCIETVCAIPCVAPTP